MRHALPLLALITACDGTPPLDPDAAAQPGSIAGTVVLAAGGTPATTFVTVYRADDPGPPTGTGRPVTFATVPADTYGSGALPSAPFTVTGLPPGDYLVAALVDRDGDFSPFGSGLAGATCGDGVGAHVADLASQAPAPVTVVAGRQARETTVVVGAPLDSERPAFTVDGAVALGAFAQGLLPTFAVEAVGVDATYAADLVLALEGPCTADDDGCTGPACPCQPAACETALPLWLVDADGDGRVDPHPDPELGALGVLDVWPRVVLTAPDDAGGLWVALGQPLALELAGAYAQGADATALGLALGVPTAARRLSVSVLPAARHDRADGTSTLVDLGTGVPDDLPRGAWAVTLVAPTGQTWTVPNEIGLDGLPPGAPDQAAALVVTD